MIVNNQKKIEFINDCNCIVDYQELEKAILWYQERPTTRLKHIYMHGEYPAVTILEKKIHIHRLLGMYWNNNKKLKRELYVHHKDGNKLNASKENLEIVENRIHQSKHNKGKTISEKHKDAIRKYNYTRKGVLRGIIKKNVSYKKIWELHQKGYSINKISKDLKYDWQQVKVRIKEIYDNPELLGE